MTIMTEAKTSPSNIQKLFRQHAELLLEEKFEEWLDLWDENGVFEHPYSPEGFPKRLVGKAAIAEYMQGIPNHIRITSHEIIDFYESPNGEEGVIEFTAKGDVVGSELKYEQHYISLIKSKNGKITLYRDFWNPLVTMKLMAALGMS